MMWILSGLVLGVFISISQLSKIGSLFDSLISILIQYVQEILSYFLYLAEPFPQVSGPLSALVIILSVATPGLFVAFLVLLSRSAIKYNRFIFALIVLFSMLSLFFMPFMKAVIIIVIALLISSFGSLLKGASLVMPLITLATLTAYRYCWVLLSGTDPIIASATSKLVLLVPYLDPFIVRLSFLTIGIIPFFAIAAVLLRLDKKDISAL